MRTSESRWERWARPRVLISAVVGLLVATVTMVAAYSVLLDGKSYRVHLSRGREQWLASLCGREYALDVVDPRARSSRSNALGGHGQQVLSAPMPGKIVKRLVKEGDHVEAGQGIIVVEAMKMQNEMRAVHAGRVVSLPVSEGATVTAGDTLAIIE